MRYSPKQATTREAFVPKRTARAIFEEFARSLGTLVCQRVPEAVRKATEEWLAPRQVPAEEPERPGAQRRRRERRAGRKVVQKPGRVGKNGKRSGRPPKVRGD
jgi:hypothetical protein